MGVVIRNKLSLDLCYECASGGDLEKCSECARQYHSECFLGAVEGTGAERDASCVVCRSAVRGSQGQNDEMLKHVLQLCDRFSSNHFALLFGHQVRPCVLYDA